MSLSNGIKDVGTEVENVREVREDRDSKVEEKILEMLNIYPGIRMSMMHNAVQVPTRVWRPVFERLLGAGRVIKVVCVDGDGKGKMYTKFFRAEDALIYEKTCLEQHNLTTISRQ